MSFSVQKLKMEISCSVDMEFRVHVVVQSVYLDAGVDDLMDCGRWIGVPAGISLHINNTLGCIMGTRHTTFSRQATARVGEEIFGNGNVDDLTKLHITKNIQNVGFPCGYIIPNKTAVLQVLG